MCVYKCESCTVAAGAKVNYCDGFCTALAGLCSSSGQAGLRWSRELSCYGHSCAVGKIGHPVSARGRVCHVVAEVS